MAERSADVAHRRGEWAEVGYRGRDEAPGTGLVLEKPAADDNAYRITKEQIGLVFGVMFSGAHWILVGLATGHARRLTSNKKQKICSGIGVSGACNSDFLFPCTDCRWNG